VARTLSAEALPCPVLRLAHSGVGRDCTLRPVPLHPSHRRVLEAAERKGIALDIVTFQRKTATAEEAAAAVGADLGQIVKSLIWVADHEEGLEPYLVLVSGRDRVDPARLALVLGESSLRRATAREAHTLTGFSIGGIPPIGHLRPIQSVMDPALGRHTVVWAAAGTSSAVFSVTPATLRVLANALVAPIAEERAWTAPVGTAADGTSAQPDAEANA
jgi:prolyl-tRNA editing enzyme YbaK/EbsC (Cys-tRNA(Pro) deacylase)